MKLPPFSNHRIKSTLCLFAAIVASFTPSNASAASFQSLGTLPGDNYSIPMAISGDGSTVVGLGNRGSEQVAFRWTQSSGTMSPIGHLSNAVNFAADTSIDGNFVAGYSNDGSHYEAFVWNATSSTITDLSPIQPTSGNSLAYAISGDGKTIAGSSYTNSDDDIAVRWTQSLADPTGNTYIAEELGRLTNTGTSRAYGISADGKSIVGKSTNIHGAETQDEAFLWTQAQGTNPATMIPLGDLTSADGGSSIATNISADGSTVIGHSSSDTQITEAFVWKNNSMTGLGVLPGSDHDFSIARGVSADGSRIVGISASAPFFQFAFLSQWDPITQTYTMSSLKDIFIQEGILPIDTQWQLLQAFDISDDGYTITGYGYHPNLQQKVPWIAQLDAPTPNPIPLPTASLTGLLGFTLLAITRRKPKA